MSRPRLYRIYVPAVWREQNPGKEPVFAEFCRYVGGPESTTTPFDRFIDVRDLLRLKREADADIKRICS